MFQTYVEVGTDLSLSEFVVLAKAEVKRREDEMIERARRTKELESTEEWQEQRRKITRDAELRKQGRGQRDLAGSDTCMYPAGKTLVVPCCPTCEQVLWWKTVNTQTLYKKHGIKLAINQLLDESMWPPVNTVRANHSEPPTFPPQKVKLTDGQMKSLEPKQCRTCHPQKKN